MVVWCHENSEIIEPNIKKCFYVVSAQSQYTENNNLTIRYFYFFSSMSPLKYLITSHVALPEARLLQPKRPDHHMVFLLHHHCFHDIKP